MTAANAMAGRFESRSGRSERIVAFWRAAVHATTREMQMRRDQRRLEDAPDHILKDLGIHRSEVRAITRMGREAYRAARHAR